MPGTSAIAHAELVGVPDPFPGLRPFEANEEIIFRGRQQHTDELLRRLATHRFLAVVGTSGSGKSSLVRAGLRPALDRGYLAGTTSRWRIAITRPGMAPIENLAKALSDTDALGTADEAKLRSSWLGLVETVRDAKLARGESVLVVVDQFEEIFRYQRQRFETDGGTEAALFVNLLLTGAARPNALIYVVLTMRSDFLGDCAQFPGLPESLSESQYLIPRLTREQRRQAIEEPLRLFGAKMTPQLVERLLNDSGDEVSDPGVGAHYRGGAPDPLPVLQHALMRTYLDWKSAPPSEADGRIDITHYQKAGSMASALNDHAEQVFNSTDLDDAGRRWAERIFRCLTTTELGRPVRRPTPLAKLYEVIGARRQEDQARVDEALRVFEKRENSFLKVHSDQTVDIMHESLIWKWRRLGDWVKQEAAGAELYRDLVKDAGGKATWGEPKLSSAIAVRERDGWNEAWAGQYSEKSFQGVLEFLERSRKAVRNQKWLRWFGAAAAVGLIILGVVVKQQAGELEAIKLGDAALTDSVAKDLATRKQYNADLQDRLDGLNSVQGATKEERDRIAKQKSDLEAQLKKSQEDSQKLEAQAKQSTDLLATVKSLQSRLDQVQNERDEAVQARVAESKQRQDAETKASQLQTQVNSLTKDPENARAAATRPEPAIRPEPSTKETAPAQPQQAKVPPPQEKSQEPPVTGGRLIITPVPPVVGQRAGETHVNSKDGLTYVWIPPGTFTMGCSLGDKDCIADEKPVHEVTISKGFWMGQTPVTQEAYQRVIGSNPSNFKGPRLPVEQVTWDQANSYCETVGMRLPTEAGWEYAARGGSTAARYGDLDKIAWYSGNSGRNTHEVGQQQANRFDLYDMLGNVWQWTADWYDYKYYKPSSATDPRGPSTGTQRVLRGGSWLSIPRLVRASDRNKNEPSVRNYRYGFRCAGEVR
jgi:formylglycine-generating enzyme required for sulfatase activity